ncbi:hypothetical protein HRI_003914200 [Hibiscus trionum]|uniref:Uncharacterized protein n=1 Tax=Hibiscus trionum TaxID=183268 RepID=A0A9W7IU34_HIBTR|nr:hypothetical protein HRI_003914200 [Hibiscus trionum]
MSKPTKMHLQAAKRALMYLKGTVNYGIFYKRGVVSWSSRKQPLVTLSTTKAKFVAAVVCACQDAWMRRILEKLGHMEKGSTTIMCNSSSAIKLSKNLFCSSKDQVADVMTKPLKLEDFLRLRHMLGVCEVLDKLNT